MARTRFLLLLQCLSYCLLAIATGLSAFGPTTSSLGFGVSLLAAVTSGSSQSIGEVLVVSRCYHLPSISLGAWGMGTGLSGLVAPLVYTLCKSIYSGSSGYGTIIFMLSLNVLIPIFYYAFKYVDHVNTHMGRAAKGDCTELYKCSDSLDLTSASEGLACAWPIVLNFGAVYFLEYLITQSFLDRSTLRPDAHGFIDSNAYTLAYAGYNLGVALSRGVVGMFANCMVWGTESTVHYMRYTVFDTDTAAFIAYAICMVFVGLMGGTSYSACYAYFRDSPTVPDRLREVLVNVSYGVSSLGMLLSSLSALALSKTVLSECSVYDCSY
ncbi:hypothetical protein FOL47_000037 [Perkinsus chesapeaki]|uniref:Uncharacterized protein n=1 Tax=Perkinsus chesapeaki TaxID=330153 RepID=A0A7J6N315_PERCH|nr:hypothetical protein FOL47_000037 [Perkinsus chesapeaki]